MIRRRNESARKESATIESRLRSRRSLEPALAKLVVGVDDLVLSTLFSRGAGAEQRKRNAGSKTQRAGRAWIDGAGSVHSLPLKYHEPILSCRQSSRAVAARGPSVGFARAPRVRAQWEHASRRVPESTPSLILGANHERMECSPRDL